MKKCSTCREMKSLGEFHLAATRHDGHTNRCKLCAIIIAGDWYKNNKDKKRAYDAKRREEKRHLYRDASKRWHRAHPDRKNADTSARRKRVRQRMPPWIIPSAMKCFYEQAQRVSLCLSIAHHVDHIIPLRGKTVSGLHVPWNLQVISATKNMRKQNCFTG